MTDGFTAQTGDLRSTAPRYGAVTDRVATIYQTLVNALEAEGACWGNDDSGRAWGSKYAPAALAALQQMSGTQQGLQSMVDGICSWARNFVDVDQMVQESAAQIASTDD